MGFIDKIMGTGKVSPSNKTVNGQNTGSETIFTMPKVLIAQNATQVANLTGLSKKFVEDIRNLEGLSLEAYKDVNVVSIFIGHKIKENEKAVLLSRKVAKTEPQAYHFLAKDLKNTQKELNEMVAVKNLTGGQKEGLVDLTFNMGKGQVKGSKLINYVKNKQYDKAVKEFNYITTDGNIVNPGLCKRRIYDISRFANGRHNKASIGAMEEIQKKGLATYKVNNDAKKYYIKVTSEIIEQARKSIKTTKQTIGGVKKTINKTTRKI